MKFEVNIYIWILKVLIEVLRYTVTVKFKYKIILKRKNDVCNLVQYEHCPPTRKLRYKNQLTPTKNLITIKTLIQKSYIITLYIAKVLDDTIYNDLPLGPPE